MNNPTLPSFRYGLEQQAPHTSCGGLVRGASARRFPVSQGIAGASMRLQPGCLRELHWHTTAAELGYVVSGSCRTTVLSPDGAVADTFGPGDVWYFPSGWGHSIQGTGPSECHFILMFDNGAFSEDQPSGGVVCTMTLRLSKFPVSVERSYPSTHANCMSELRESCRITITQIIIADINDAQQ